MWHGAGVAAVVCRALALDPASRPGADLVLALVLAPDLPSLRPQLRLVVRDMGRWLPSAGCAGLLWCRRRTVPAVDTTMNRQVDIWTM
jgi:hypothetical protein